MAGLDPAIHQASFASQWFLCARRRGHAGWQGQALPWRVCFL